MAWWFRIPLGLLVVALGIHMVWKTDVYFGMTGRIPWAEEKIGPGGTGSFLKIVGVVICFIGMFIATNIANDILTSFAGIFVRR